jgi:hypothetical protein
MRDVVFLVSARAVRSCGSWRGQGPRASDVRGSPVRRGSCVDRSTRVEQVVWTQTLTTW